MADMKHYINDDTQDVIGLQDGETPPAGNWRMMSDAEFEAFKNPPPVLADYKEAVKTSLREACEAQIVGKFFISDAHTDGYEYDCRTVDQINLQRAHIAATSSGGTVDVYAHNGVEFVPVPHTAVQVAGVLEDMESSIAAKRAVLYMAVSAVNAAPSIEAVDAVVAGVIW